MLPIIKNGCHPEVPAPFSRAEGPQRQVLAQPICGVPVPSMQKQSRQRRRDTHHSNEYSTDPKQAPLGEQRDRANYQPHFQQRLSGVKAIRAAADQVALFLKFLRSLADVCLVRFIPLLFLQILVANCRGLFLVRWRQCAQQIRDAFHLMEANILRLVVRPLIGGSRLQEQFLGIRAMSQQRRAGHQHPQNRNGQRNRERVAILFAHFGNFRNFRLIFHSARSPFLCQVIAHSHAVAGGCKLRKRAISCVRASNFCRISLCRISSVSGFLATNVSVPPGSRTHWRTSESESKPCLRAAAANSCLVISSFFSLCSYTFPFSIKTSGLPSTICSILLWS